MESTKAQIVALLRSWNGGTAHQLASALGMSPAAVRRHLDGLRAEGWVDVRIQRHMVGRPAFVFYLTEQGEEASARGYSRLLGRMFRGLLEMERAEVGGRKGDEVLEKLFEDVAGQIAREHGPEVAGRTLEERVDQASRALHTEGIVDHWDRVPGGYRLVNVICPYRRVAQVSDGPCGSDRLAIELLVGRPVEQVGRVVQGHPCCEYVVRVEGTGSDPAETGARAGRSPATARLGAGRDPHLAPETGG